MRAHRRFEKPAFRPVSKSAPIIHAFSVCRVCVTLPPHRHTNEELLILKEGTLEALVDGQWKKVGPGSIVFQASNSCHGVRNIGTTPATYHIVNWSSPGKLKTNGPAVSCTP